MKLRGLFGMLLALSLLSAWAGEDDAESRPWQEREAVLPEFPRPGDWLPFAVSAASSNRFFVDARSLRVDDDGVVRYVLLVETAEGARNLTFEGMRCETRERRLYASGRGDASWSPSRNRAWQPIRDAVANRHYAALFSEYFCPVGVIVRDAAEALLSLRQGVHPLNERIGN